MSLETMSAGRKIFHCAVDDTVLTTNISEVKRWASNGAITLFVPLYTLERLQAPKRGASQAAINSREAVRFLDRVTSGKDNIPADRVVLQGPMEQYENWTDAEQYFLPEFEDQVEESNEIADDHEGVSTPKIEAEIKANGFAKESPKGPGLPGLPSDLSQMLLSKLNFKEPEPITSIHHNDIKSSASLPSTGTQSDQGSRASSRSSGTSPESAERNGTKQTNGHRRSASTSSVIPPTPTVLQPLLSALLWRLHANKETQPVQTLTLVTNDNDTQAWAEKFGIMTKSIHQLRTSIQYEEKEFKNRVKYAEKAQHDAPDPKPLFSYDNDSEEDELVFVPRGRGKGASRNAGGRGGGSSRKARAAAAAAAVAAPTEASVEVPSQPIDPNSFSRSLGPGTPSKKQVVDLSSQSGAARGLSASSRRQGGGGRRAGGSRANSSRGGRGHGKLWVP